MNSGYHSKQDSANESDPDTETQRIDGSETLFDLVLFT
jgi:hypothetical protein